MGSTHTHSRFLPVPFAIRSVRVGVAVCLQRDAAGQGSASGPHHGDDFAVAAAGAWIQIANNGM